MIDGRQAEVPTLLRQKLLHIFKTMLKIKEKGIDLFFTNIDKIKNQIVKELEQKTAIS